MLHSALRVAPLVICTLLVSPLTAQPPATAPSLCELFHADIRDRKLHVSLTATARDRVTLVTDTDEEWNIAINATPVIGRFAHFTVTCDAREDDRWSDLHLVSVESDAQGLRISGIGRAADNSVAVTFFQDAHGVQLIVTRSRRRPRPIEDAAAADLVQLFNEHQPQVRTYLAPLLDEISSRSVLRPRAADVYRVFATIPADPVVVAKLAEFLPQLDSTDAKQRDDASAKLQALGGAAVLAALRMDMSQLSPEQRGRLGALIDASTLWLDPVAAARDPHFLVDCLDHDEPDVRSEALTALRALAGRDIDFDAAAPLAARRAAAAEMIEMLDQPQAQPAAARE